MKTTIRGARRRTMGDPILNLNPANVTTCPPGTHYVADAIQGIRACVPNAPKLTLHLGAGKPAAAPPPPPPAPVRLTLHLGTHPVSQPIIPPAATASAPPSTDAGAAPVTTPAPAACDPCWPWWWLLVAAVAGGGAGYALSGKKGAKRRKNAASRVGGYVLKRVNPVAHATKLLGL